jgi:hypothetical protein
MRFRACFNSSIADVYNSIHFSSGLSLIVTDIIERPSRPGSFASRASTKRGFRDRNWRTEQYFGPSSEAESPDLSERIRHLPEGFVTDHVNLRSRHVSPGAIVHPRAIIAGSIGKNTLMLCPLIADKVGWRSDPNDAFTFLDREGHTVAYTLYWRDGGIPSRHRQFNTPTRMCRARPLGPVGTPKTLSCEGLRSEGLATVSEVRG